MVTVDGKEYDRESLCIRAIELYPSMPEAHLYTSKSKDLMGARQEFTFAPPARIVHKEINYSATAPGVPCSAAQFNRTTEIG